MTAEQMNLALASEMGWTPDIDTGYWIPPGERKLKVGHYTANPPNYATDANAALEIVEMMRERGWSTVLDNAFAGRWECELIGDRGKSITETAPTATLAICAAACRALGL